MTDELVRALERELATSGSVEARLGLARELRRAGRSDDAVRTLLAASGEPSVQRELAAWPSWGTPAGEGTRWHSGPFLEAPRLRWSQGVSTSASSGQLVASPLGIAWTRGPQEQALCFDPESGRRTRAFPPARILALQGSRLALGEALRIELRELGAPAPLDEVRLDPTGPEPWRVAFESVRVDEDGAGLLWAAGHGVVEARRLVPDGGAATNWRRELPVTRCLAEGDLVVADDLFRGLRREVIALDRATGATRWRVPGAILALDAGGVFLSEPDGKETDLVLRRRDGEVVWRRPGSPGAERAYGPEVVVEGRVEGRRRVLLVLDRATGEERTRQEVTAPGLGHVFQVADAILHWPEYGLLRACDHALAERWRFQLDPHTTTGSGPVALTPGRILVASADRLVCLEDGA